MKVLITGAGGFIGKNLAAELKNRGYDHLLEYDMHTEEQVLEAYVRECDFVFHLAGVNRPKEEEDFFKGNVEFTARLLDLLKKYQNRAPVVFASSVQAALNNPYGISKRKGEELLAAYTNETGAKTFAYRLANVFGKWCRPNYNSAVATFCHNIARNLPIHISNENAEVRLIYIDDILEAFINTMEGKEYHTERYYEINPVYQIALGELTWLIRIFKKSRGDLSIPNMSDEFTKKLYSTYLSYLPEDQLSYPLEMKKDPRGSFTEFIRTPDRGQISVNISKPGIIKGNHWHHTKNEKFLVVSGRGLVQLRKLGSDQVITHKVSGEKLEVIDIPPGYAHNIINEGESDMVTLIWADSPFDPKNPDTYYLEV